MMSLWTTGKYLSCTVCVKRPCPFLTATYASMCIKIILFFTTSACLLQVKSILPYAWGHAKTKSNFGKGIGSLTCLRTAELFVHAPQILAVDLGEFGFVYANTSSNKEKDVLLLEDGDGDEQWSSVFFFLCGFRSSFLCGLCRLMLTWLWKQKKVGKTGFTDSCQQNIPWDSSRDECSLRHNAALCSDVFR